MGFVNERISNADKARIDSGELKHPVFGHPLFPSEWTIDRERDIALIPAGSGGEPATRQDGTVEQQYLFVMYWQGKVINVHATESHTGNFRTGDFEITWNIVRLVAPESLPREEVRTILKEALLAFGYVSIDFRSQVTAVHFNF